MDREWILGRIKNCNNVKIGKNFGLFTKNSNRNEALTNMAIQVDLAYLNARKDAERFQGIFH